MRITNEEAAHAAVTLNSQARFRVDRREPEEDAGRRADVEQSQEGSATKAETGIDAHDYFVRPRAMGKARPGARRQRCFPKSVAIKGPAIRQRGVSLESR